MAKKELQSERWERRAFRVEEAACAKTWKDVQLGAPSGAEERARGGKG